MRPSNESDSEEDMDIKKLLKEVEYLGMPIYIISFPKPNSTFLGDFIIDVPQLKLLVNALRYYPDWYQLFGWDGVLY